MTDKNTFKNAWMGVITDWQIHAVDPSLPTTDSDFLQFKGKFPLTREEVIQYVYSHFGTGLYRLTEQTLDSMSPKYLSSWMLFVDFNDSTIKPVETFLKRQAPPASEYPANPDKYLDRPGRPVERDHQIAIRVFLKHLKDEGLTPKSWAASSRKARAPIWEGFREILRRSNSPLLRPMAFDGARRAINRHLRALTDAAAKGQS